MILKKLRHTSAWVMAACLCLSGCQTLLPSERFTAAENEKIAQGEAQNTRISQRVVEFYENNPHYKPVAEAVENASFKSGLYSLEAQRLLNAAHIQDQLPQFTPSISLDENGFGVARLLVDQILFSNGRLKAGKLTLNAQEARALAQYRLEENENVVRALAAYLDCVRYQKTVDAAEELIAFYNRFGEMAQARVDGGVANRTEVRLFELKKAQAEAQLVEAHSELRRAQIELALYTDSDLETGDYARLNFESQYLDVNSETGLLENDPILYTPEYRVTVATLDERVAEHKFAKAERIPELKIIGGFGLGSSAGLLSNNSLNFARLSFDTQNALSWGANLELKSKEAQVFAAEAAVNDRRRQINIALLTQNALIESFTDQLTAKNTISILANQRALSFSEDFLAGAVGLLEIVSVLETVKSVKLDAIATEHALHLTEVEKAAALGILGPFPVPEDLKVTELK